MKPTYEELAAQVEHLRYQITKIALCYGNNTGNEPSLSVFHRALDEAQESIDKTPHQCLLEIRAEAVDRAVRLYTHKLGCDEGLNEVGFDIIRRFGEYIHPDGLRDYAQQLRSGECDQYCQESLKEYQ